MGCDIHMYVERREDGVWVSADTWVDDDEYGEVRRIVPYGEYIYSDRSYDLFAALADVRNRGGITPIHDQRGVPDDASAEYKAEVEWWNGDGHSHSWATLAELKAFDWDQFSYEPGFVVDAVPELEKLGAPEDVRVLYFFDN